VLSRGWSCGGSHQEIVFIEQSRVREKSQRVVADEDVRKPVPFLKENIEALKLYKHAHTVAI